MVNLLHIDTSADNGMIAVATNGVPVAIRTVSDSRNQAAEINKLIEEAVAEAGIAISGLQGVVVCAGPGSYTGLRIGMSTAKAICYVNDIPLFLDNKLALLAYQALQKNPGYDECISLIPARENEYFFASYSPGMEEVVPPVHRMASDISESVGENKKILCVSNMSLGVDIDLGDNAVHIISNEMLDISLWATYALEQYNCNRSVNLAMTEPFYLKQVYTHNSKKNNQL